MTLKIEDFFQFQYGENTGRNGVWGIFITLEDLSLDACVPFYRDRLFLPTAIPDEFRFILQEHLKEYDKTYTIKTYKEQKSWRKDIVNACLQGVSRRYGEQVGRLLGAWVAVAGDSDTDKIFSKIMEGTNCTDRGMLRFAMPPMLKRYNTLKEFFQAPAPLDWEDALAPQALQSRWDKKFYAMHYDPDPDEECNTYNPNDGMSLAHWQMCCRLAWDSTMKSCTEAQFDEINHWLVEVADIMSFPDDMKWADVRKLFLPELLRQHYLDQGLLLSYDKLMKPGDLK